MMTIFLSNRPPVHVPSHAEALADPTGEEAARQLKKRLDERATTGPTQDFKGSDGGPLPSEQKGAASLDIGTQRLLDDARAKTKEGAQKFKSWHARLHQKHADQLAPYLEQLRADADAADVARESA